jgi:hypothetical protein
VLVQSFDVLHSGLAPLLLLDVVETVLPVEPPPLVEVALPLWQPG